MRIIRVALITACVTLTANSARAQDPFDPFRLPTIGDVVARNVQQLLSGIQDFHEAGARASEEIEAARKAFWSQYPNGPRHAATEKAFADALLAKDFYYLSLAAQEDCNGPATRVLDRVSKFDGGIPTDAYLAFCDLVDAVRAHFGVYGKKQFPFDAIAEVIPAALKLKEFDKYKQARDWSEFARAGKAPYKSWKDLEDSKDPKLYAYVLVQSPTEIVGHSFPVQIGASAQRFKYLADKHGNNTMLSMAEKIMHAPRGTTTAIGKPDQIVPNPDRMARADDLRKAGWTDAQSSMCSGKFISDCYLNLIGEVDPASTSDSIPTPPSTGGPRRGRGGAAGASVGVTQPIPTRPSPTRPPDVNASGSGLPTTTPNVAAASGTAQSDRSAADQARTEACDQRSVISAQIAATNRERFEAERKMNSELSAYRQELARQHVPAAEAVKRYNEKQATLKESSGINALDQRTKQLGDQQREAQRACIAAVTSPSSPVATRPQPPQQIPPAAPQSNNVSVPTTTRTPSALYDRLEGSV